MQIMSPPQGLQAYPGQGFGQQMNQLAEQIMTFAKIKKSVEDEQNQRKLDLYMKTGEIQGELDKPTPEIQKAFKDYYGVEPQGVFKTGGKTLAGRKADTEIESSKADIERKKSMATWYANRKTSDKNTDTKALDYAVKYANSKLGKPFEVLSDEERGMWQSYHDEGMQEYFKVSGGGVSGSTGKMRNPAQEAFINSWKALPPAEKNKITDKSYQAKLNKKLQTLGLTLQDLR